MTCANRLAPAVLFSIGCTGFAAVLTVHAQAYFRQASSMTSICAGIFVALTDFLGDVTQVLVTAGAMFFLFRQIVHDALTLEMQWKPPPPARLAFATLGASTRRRVLVRILPAHRL